MLNKYKPHLIELKKRLFCYLGFYLISFVFCYLNTEQLLSFIIQPLIAISNNNLIYTHLTEAFFINIKLSALSSFLICWPIAIWHIYKFAMPGLYKNEQLNLFLILISSSILFLCGIILVYYFIMPKAWLFFLSFQNEKLILQAKINEYFSLTLSLMLAFGIAFQLPLILVILFKLKLIELSFLTNNRKYAILIIFIIAAILTPPDIISQIGLAIPMLLLYEIAIIICKNLQKEKNS